MSDQTVMILGGVASAAFMIGINYQAIKCFLGFHEYPTYHDWSRDNFDLRYKDLGNLYSVRNWVNEINESQWKALNTCIHCDKRKGY